MAARDLLRLVVGLAACVLLQGAQAASAVHKCVIAGTVTFQNTPCPAETPTRRPTTEALNAERKKRLAESAPASAPATPTARTSAAPPRTAAMPPAPPPEPAAPRPEVLPSDAGFRCDGRLYCSQMRSCSEARYFLAHCPGVKMDGNHDGVPCQQQWCGSPLTR